MRKDLQMSLFGNTLLLQMAPGYTLVDSPAVDLARVIAALAPADVVNRADTTVLDLAYDARAVSPGALFFCVRGEHADGHEFAAAAVDQGAVALVVERPVEATVPQLVVADSRRAMAVAAATFFDDPSRELVLVGVTGTNGKTTTSFLLFGILAAAGLRPGLLGTIESRVGGERRAAVRTTPESIDLQRTLREMVDVGDRSCAMEATSHGSELGRLDELHFSALIFTNLSHDHLDFHGTLERYYASKRRLFVDGEPPPAAINVDDEHGRRLADELRSAKHERLVTFGFSNDADVRPTSIELSREGAALTASGIPLRTRLLGRFNVENVLAAVAASRLIDLPEDAIARGVESVHGVPGRFEAVDEGQPFAVVVDYAHTPDSLTNALRTARDLTEGRLICVFGCGGDRDRAKRPLMGEAASRHADVAIVTSDNPRGEDPEAIAAEIVEGAVHPVDVELDRQRAIERAIAMAGEGDFILVAGKGHELGQEVAGRVLPFDDLAVTRETLRRLGAPT
jgi:UDP-N-acetylmuramoyl-L-alanyl-D-glutamate--2,6-diaminopimelate ligase